MCTDLGAHGSDRVAAWRPAERREPLDIPLQPVDSLTITALMVNTTRYAQKLTGVQRRAA